MVTKIMILERLPPDYIAYKKWINSGVTGTFTEEYLMSIYSFSDYMKYVRPEELKQ